MKSTWWLLASFVAIVLAIVWMFVQPEQTVAASGARRALLTYGHSASWLFLSLMFAMYAFGGTPFLCTVFGVLAAASYALFLAALLI